jgi:hypothetical protein
MQVVAEPVYFLKAAQFLELAALVEEDQAEH